MINTKAIRNRMTDFNLTNAELADKVGVSSAYLNWVIEGRKDLTLSMAEKIQAELDISNDEFGFYFLSGGRETQ